MAITTITGLSAARMIQIEQASVTSGAVEGDELILRTRGGSPITAGNVRGPKGVKGDPGGINDATTTVQGGIKLAGNLKGTANTPTVTGSLDNTVNVTNTTVSAVFEGSPVSSTITNLYTTVLTIFNSFLRKSGTANTVWSGTETAYNQLPAGTRNAAGFIAVITP